MSGPGWPGRARILALALALAAAVGPAQAAAATGPLLIFVLNSPGADVSQVDSVSLGLVRRIPAGKEPPHLSLTPDETSLVVASLQDSDEFVAIDLATQAQRWTVTAGRMPADFFLMADDRRLLVALTGDRFFEAWDFSAAMRRLLRHSETGVGAHVVRAHGDGRHVFVSPRFHRLHHGIGVRDQLHGRDDGRGFWAQQWLGLKRLAGR